MCGAIHLVFNAINLIAFARGSMVTKLSECGDDKYMVNV